MCIAKDIAESIIKIIDQIEIEQKILANKLSISNKEEQIVLHKLEDFKFNACEGYYVAKQLQDIRIKRRDIKNEIAYLNSLTSNMNFFTEFKKQLQYKMKTLDNIEENIGKKYHSHIGQNFAKDSNLQKLRQVNQSKIKFKPTPEYDRIVELLKQVN